MKSKKLICTLCETLRLRVVQICGRREFRVFSRQQPDKYCSQRKETSDSIYPAARPRIGRGLVPLRRRDRQKRVRRERASDITAAICAAVGSPTTLGTIAEAGPPVTRRDAEDVDTTVTKAKRRSSKGYASVDRRDCARKSAMKIIALL